MLTTVICNQCNEPVIISNRSTPLPYVCIGCQEKNGDLTTFAQLAGGYAKPGTFADKTGTFESDGFAYTPEDNPHADECVNCAHDDCGGCEYEEEPQEEMDEAAQLMFDMQQQIDQLIEQNDTLAEEVARAQSKALATHGALEVVIEILAKAFISLGEKEAEVLRAQDMEAASHTKLAEMMHERDEARKDLARHQRAIEGFNKEFFGDHYAIVPDSLHTPE